MVHFHVITVFPYEPSIVVDRYAMFIPGFNWTSVAEATLDARRARLRTVNGCCGLALGQTVLVVRWFCVRSTQVRNLCVGGADRRGSASRSGSPGLSRDGPVV